MPSKRLSREELYEMVWSKPLMHLAEELGISDRGLGKTCTRLEIPLPGRGYWRKVEMGHQVDKDALPPASESCQRFASFRGPYKKPEPIVVPDSDIVDKAKAYESKTENQITVPEMITRYNPLVKKTLELLLEATWDKQGLYKPVVGEALDLACTKEMAPRAAKIYQVLLQSFQKRKYPISVNASYPHDTYVSCFGEKIKISMREKLKQVPFKRPKGQAPSSFDPKMVFIPSGRLVLRIDEYSSDSREHCVDTDDLMLEDQLNEFMVRLAKAALYLKRRRAEWEQREREWEASRQEEERIKQQEKMEQVRRSDFDNLVSDWVKAKQIREYIELIRPIISRSIYDDMSKDEWLEWASKYADELDPITLFRSSGSS